MSLWNYRLDQNTKYQNFASFPLKHVTVYWLNSKDFLFPAPNSTCLKICNTVYLGILKLVLHVYFKQGLVLHAHFKKWPQWWSFENKARFFLEKYFLIWLCLTFKKCHKKLFLGSFRASWAIKNVNLLYR